MLSGLGSKECWVRNPTSLPRSDGKTCTQHLRRQLGAWEFRSLGHKPSCLVVATT